jgi:chitinase
MRRAALLWLGLAAIAGAGTVTASGADYTATSPSPGNAFGAAADFNTVAVSLSDPGAALRGTVALAATASSERGIDRVRFQSSPAGIGAWADVCEDASAPYACAWDTAGVADGSRDLRAVAVDQAGYQRSAPVAARVVDNTLPSASLADPGVLQGTETLTATASDATSGLATLEIAHRPAGGAWITLCSGSTSPRSCALDATTLADGSHELRARATDAAGNVRDVTLTRTADNAAPAVSVVPPGALRGSATISMNADDGDGAGVVSVTGQFRPAGGTWSDACVDTDAPYQCTVDTSTVPDGLYEARAIAADGAGLSSTSAAVTDIRVDNTAPAAPTIANPGTPLSGSVALTGTAADGGSGIAAWIVQYRSASGGTWTDACTDTTPAYGCSWDTTGLADELYDVRSLARDAAGNETGSAVVANRRVDNVAPAVSLTDPGSPLSGTVTLDATASDGGGIASVVFERSPAGAGGWTAICTDNTAPYTCSFNTTTVGDDAYDIRARATDNGGRSGTSPVGARVVDNDTTPTGTDVQTRSTGATAGRLDIGDEISLTFSEPIAPASVLPGWTGGSQAIRVAVTNSANNDRMDFLDSTGATRLNLVRNATDLRLDGNFVTAATLFNATMTAGGSTITITLGSMISGTPATSSANGTMSWRPNAGALDLAGHATSTTAVTETGGADRDF